MLNYYSIQFQTNSISVLDYYFNLHNSLIHKSPFSGIFVFDGKGLRTFDVLLSAPL